MDTVFANVNIALIRSNILKRRLALFEKQVHKYGGSCTAISNISNITNATHVVFEEDYLAQNKSLQEVLKMIVIEDCGNLPFEVVSSMWVSQCIKVKQLVDAELYRFKERLQEEAVPPQHRATIDDAGNNNLTRSEVVVRLLMMGHPAAPPLNTGWDERDDTWLHRMPYLRKGFFATGIIPKYD